MLQIDVGLIQTCLGLRGLGPVDLVLGNCRIISRLSRVEIALGDQFLFAKFCVPVESSFSVLDGDLPFCRRSLDGPTGDWPLPDQPLC